MAGKTNLYEYQLESIAKWLSCNGEAWGMGPTIVFASAAALFLYNELQATVFIAGDHAHVSLLEKTLVSSMIVGMLALMVHLWVCSMRFFQYYLDTLIKDSPSILLELTTAGLLGQTEIVPLGPLTRFLKQQQPQIHITVCWFLSLCYADYVRKHYCQRFNMPYLEQWQAELHERATHGVNSTIEKVNSLVCAARRRLRGYTRTPTSDAHTVRAHARSGRRWRSAESRSVTHGEHRSSVSPAQPRPKPLRNSERTLRRHDVAAAVRRTPANVFLALHSVQRVRSELYFGLNKNR
ncbi:uncharacterized protein LOC126773852 isoform X1 [Nymphalis io]|uniref:uncharacterized protein LOC126773852 isoform X1 n=1 Tax=Inachis io TaxID=171585 RepID=UPI00216A702D|nr:uncharacterized protein LOC126773852 isoform X1 [Nymphalis io]